MAPLPSSLRQPPPSARSDSASTLTPRGQAPNTNGPTILNPSTSHLSRASPLKPWEQSARRVMTANTAGHAGGNERPQGNGLSHTPREAVNYRTTNPNPARNVGSISHTTGNSSTRGVAGGAKGQGNGEEDQDRSSAQLSELGHPQDPPAQAASSAPYTNHAANGGPYAPPTSRFGQLGTISNGMYGYPGSTYGGAGAYGRYNSGSMYGSSSLYGSGYGAGSMYGTPSMYGGMGGMYGGGYGYGGRGGMYGSMHGGGMGGEGSIGWLQNVFHLVSSLGQMTELLGMNTEALGYLFGTLMGFAETAGNVLGQLTARPARLLEAGQEGVTEEEAAVRAKQEKIVRVVRWAVGLALSYLAWRVLRKVGRWVKAGDTRRDVALAAAAGAMVGAGGRGGRGQLQPHLPPSPPPQAWSARRPMPGEGGERRWGGGGRGEEHVEGLPNAALEQAFHSSSGGGVRPGEF